MLLELTCKNIKGKCTDHNVKREYVMWGETMFPLTEPGPVCTMQTTGAKWASQSPHGNTLGEFPRDTKDPRVTGKGVRVLPEACTSLTYCRRSCPWWMTSNVRLFMVRALSAWCWRRCSAIVRSSVSKSFICWESSSFQDSRSEMIWQRKVTV